MLEGPARRGLAWCAAAAACLVPAAALAQSDTSIDVQTRWPSPGPGRFGFVRDVGVAPHLALGFGASVEYLNRPLVLVDTTHGDAESDGVGHLVAGEFLWSLGLFDAFQLGLALPVTLAQDGEGAQPATGLESDGLPTTASRDVRVELAWDVLALWRRGQRYVEREGQGLLLSVAVAFPSGDDRAFNGDDGPVLVPGLSGGWRIGPVLVAGSVEARIRSTSRFGLDGVVGSQLGLAAGASLPLLPSRRLEASLEGRALVALVADGASPVEVMGGARYITDRARDVSVAVRVGAGLTEDITTPAVRALVEVRYAPAGLDSDDDGVTEADDRCPAEAEDRDGFEDEDGCPELDNDDDGVTDDADQCDDQPEDHDGFRDEDGCPEVDNDEDGLADGEDQCPTEAEDRDGFRDDDGCPDPDNDQDRLPDTQDRCDDQPEDWDGFEDEDGCPDPDNDQDGVPDATDRCPLEPEDRDGREDTDGCPETDADGDGVPDSLDRCPLEAETYDGNQDDDGCPEETAAGPRVRWDGDRLAFRGRAPQFGRGSDVLPRDLRALVPMLARLVAGAACRHRVVIEGVDGPARPPRGGAPPAGTLGSRRAGALRDALVAAGVPAAMIAVGELPASAGGAATFVIRRDSPLESPRAECRAGAAPAPAAAPSAPAPAAAPPPPATPAPSSAPAP